MGIVGKINKLTPQVLGDAARKIGNIFNAVARQVESFPIRNTHPALLALAPKLGAKVTSILKPKPVPGVKPKPGAINDSISGQQYINLRSAMTDRASRLFSSDAAAADDIVQAISLLDDAFELAAPQGAKAALRIARERYKNLMTLRGMGEVRQAGNVTTRQANQRLSMNYGSTFDYMNTGTLLPGTRAFMKTVRQAELSRFPVGNSGTASRALAGSALLAGGAAIAGGDMETIAGLAALGLVPSLAGRANVALSSVLSGAAIPAVTTVGGVLGQAAAAQHLLESEPAE